MSYGVWLADQWVVGTIEQGGQNGDPPVPHSYNGAVEFMNFMSRHNPGVIYEVREINE